MKERRAQGRTSSKITFEELFKLLVFLLIFALLIYVMAKGLDPERILKAIIETFGGAFFNFLLFSRFSSHR